MINLLVAPSSTSSRKARQWLTEHDLTFRERDIYRRPLRPGEIKQILRLSENGCEDIVATRSNAYKQNKDRLDSLPLSQFIEVLAKHPEMLKRPIIFNDEKLLVGFNDEEIRNFLPRSLRKHNLEILLKKVAN
ncbi:Spx/MgsR family RNA polymerase-binding regulatory protein [Lentilactobacillus farraginis]|uniref:ArsC family transcriptional regulator n=1 Tax=Lentilactobacillus farraginis DSM 18382 = JCM 14108 TaxID=1423743 RepID=X0QDT6_9LACO|nr:Spx/MgsR family RNA polymerase-binding regulatory protein [Lentilactobacillus farraginis]KRM08751.1 ArsC family transcriptional regulator [Lentilactobacillus farraginis DSM 18382 = JCM 14108]GAF36785.1 arsenate reductase and related proteins, glutaredoxin family [Lentilactobacillus farraginis DSM 18382 = JCM 14108]